MRTDDFTYGCRSGIQKAVRRGDLELARTCFNALWGNKTQRAWLRWRTPVLVMEESSPLLGELAAFIKRGTDEEKEWRRFIYTLTFTPKCNEATGLSSFGENSTGVSHPELRFYQTYLREVNHGKDLVAAASAMAEEAFGSRDFSLYERDAVIFLMKRIGMGGMYGDRLLCLANISYIRHRGLDKTLIQSVIDSHAGKTLRRGLSRTDVALPWYVFDMHTVVGKTVLSIAERKYGRQWGLSKEEISKIWFPFESGIIPRSQMKYVEICKKPAQFDAMWRIPGMRGNLNGLKGMSTKELLFFWRKEMRPKIKSLVEWLLTRRSEEP